MAWASSANAVVRNLPQRGIPAVSADQPPIPRRKPHFVRSACTTGVDFRFYSMDVSDFRDVMDVFHKHSDITHAIHLAYVMGPLVDENTSLSTRVNVLGMTHMFEAAVQRKLSRLVFTSSETVYGASQHALWRAAGDRGRFLRLRLLTRSRTP